MSSSARKTQDVPYGGARTYEDALAHLNMLIPNRAVTSLFEKKEKEKEKPKEQAQPEKKEENDLAKTTQAPSPSQGTTATATTTPSQLSQLSQFSPPDDPNRLAIPEMLTWLQRAGYAPSDLAALKCIHVAGTKGKGSVCALLTAGLMSAAADAKGDAGPAKGNGDEKNKNENENHEAKDNDNDNAVSPLDKIGTYTSPHLVTPRERIAINGRPLPRDLFAKYFWELWDAFTASAAREYDEWAGSGAGASAGAGAAPDYPGGADVPSSPDGVRGPATKPFFFRFMTILAFHVFLRERVGAAVVEVGIGGAYDATNVLPAEAVSAAVVTQLGIDHVAMLGSSAESIAWHKAGIMKEARPVVTRLLGDDDGAETRGHPGAGVGAGIGVRDVLRLRAAELRADPLLEVSDEDVRAWRGPRVVPAWAAGGFQKRNMALAALAAEELVAGVRGRAPRRSLAELEGAPVVEGMGDARLRGRQEVFDDPERGVRWLLDGAHTVESLDETARWLAAEIGASPAVDGHAQGGSASTGEGRRPSKKRRVGKGKLVLLFNQQEREADKLLRGFLQRLGELVSPGDVVEEEEEEEDVFDAAVFSRNDLDDKISGPDADLTVQTSSRDAFAAIYPRVPVSTVPNLPRALAEVRAVDASDDGHGEKTTVLVTGSMHLVGNVIRLLEPEEEA